MVVAEQGTSVIGIGGRLTTPRRHAAVKGPSPRSCRQTVGTIWPVPNTQIANTGRGQDIPLCKQPEDGTVTGYLYSGGKLSHCPNISRNLTIEGPRALQR